MIHLVRRHGSMSLSLGLAAGIAGFAECLDFPGKGTQKCSQERGSPASHQHVCHAGLRELEPNTVKGKRRG